MNDTDNEQDDLEFTRRTYYDLINKGQESLDEMMNLASALEHPRAFEVVATLIKNTSDVNDKLMDLHKKKKDLAKLDKPSENSTTNNLFVGSTTDLQRMLQDMKPVDDSKIHVVEDNDNVIEFKKDDDTPTT
jgi:hypothetical protein|tara:strand:- start:1173 stop:1568 length:396 start_codon:yes stop_codon:yes gene_type:complete